MLLYLRVFLNYFLYKNTALYNSFELHLHRNWYRDEQRRRETLPQICQTIFSIRIIRLLRYSLPAKYWEQNKVQSKIRNGYDSFRSLVMVLVHSTKYFIDSRKRGKGFCDPYIIALRYTVQVGVKCRMLSLSTINDLHLCEREGWLIVFML